MASYSQVTWDEHLNSIVKELSRLPAAGLSVNFTKYIFAAASKGFFGMIIDSTGIRPSPSKLEAIEEMPPPSNIEDLRTFLGMTGYLRQFIQNYNITAAPLTYLQQRVRVEKGPQIPNRLVGQKGMSFPFAQKKTNVTRRARVA